MSEVVSKARFYGIVTVLIALLLLSSIAAAVSYEEYQRQASDTQRYIGELNTALTNYRSLAGSYNASLKDYNTTLSLLADAVSNLNTSTPAYAHANRALSSLWTSYQSLASVGGRHALAYVVRALVDYGNGTRGWYNDSSAQPGWDAYVASVVLFGGRVQAAWYPQYGEHLVIGVNGVNATGTKSWFVWEFTQGTWTPSQTGADEIHMHNGTVIAWTLCGYDAYFRPSCTP